MKLFKIYKIVVKINYIFLKDNNRHLGGIHRTLPARVNEATTPNSSTKQALQISEDSLHQVRCDRYSHRYYTHLNLSQMAQSQ